ncbi:hypothetical protein G6O67_006681 [Ophiocordyceps sinensis]|uniref:Uncharacterized protein n=1 Tax=Ophiocordyceps sinensis TaxID=72228 RepID=A0A8H4LWN1_9HYPO|nr:hypothetical protein G6O67_006681 [Ophiocordyceps sinensis]
MGSVTAELHESACHCMRLQRAWAGPVNRLCTRFRKPVEPTLAIEAAPAALDVLAASCHWHRPSSQSSHSLPTELRFLTYKPLAARLLYFITGP